MTKGQKGQALFEAALALPCMFSILLGAIELARIYLDQLHLDYACFAAARSAVVHAGTDSNWLEKAQLAALKAYLLSGSFGVPPTVESVEQSSAFEMGAPITLQLIAGTRQSTCTLTCESGEMSDVE